MSKTNIGQQGTWIIQVWLALALVLLTASAAAQNPPASGAPQLTTEQIVQGMQRHDEWQSKNLIHYQAQRHYSVAYHGFHKNILAEMVVEVEYQAGAGKSFRVISQSGSKTLCEKVLKKAYESEREASLQKSQNALTPANYRFTLAGSEQVESRPAYILQVEPITASKFLYRGKIWVDAADFAVLKMDVQPAKNPSFWITKTVIHHTNSATDGFWLPHQNRSESSIRIGGNAELTIDYGTYHVVSQAQATNATATVNQR